MFNKKLTIKWHMSLAFFKNVINRANRKLDYGKFLILHRGYAGFIILLLKSILKKYTSINKMRNDMDIEFNSQLIQSQKTVITQNQIEHLEILQMPSIDLSHYIDEILNTNPLLECDAPEYDQDPEGLSERKQEEYFCRFDRINLQSSQNCDDFISYAKTPVTLREYLKLQLLEQKIQQRYKKIVEYLIENLDVDGYLREDICDLSNVLHVPERHVKFSLKILQSFEPTGVGARNVKECLLLQLRRKKALNGSIANIIVHYFDLLASKSFVKISKETGIERNQVERIYTLIKSLNPRPGCTFQKNEWEQYIVPDLILIQIDGKYILQFNDESIPSIRINNYYLSLMRSSESNPEVKNYIKKNLSGAEWLVKAIEHRKSTILSVADYIVAFQKDFFERGSEYVKPLTMKMVAESLGIHISTVSRTVNDKYIQTPKGIYALRYFFSSTVETEFENKMSSVSVKNMIRRIVLEEDKKEPLSDEQIRGRLECMGVKVARRTVAKYREELSVLSAALRKC